MDTNGKLSPIIKMKFVFPIVNVSCCYCWMYIQKWWKVAWMHLHNFRSKSLQIEKELPYLWLLVFYPKCFDTLMIDEMVTHGAMIFWLGSKIMSHLNIIWDLKPFFSICLKNFSDTIPSKWKYHSNITKANPNLQFAKL